uniref:Protein kinase domain-containing protein n=1 Tax=Kalanchoe fedtschenkoi TaxID=63787 RepID=A0A7N0UJR6_KALFE
MDRGRSSLSSRQSHISFEDYAWLKRRCREEDVGNDHSASSCTSRRLGVCTAPELGGSSLVAPGRGLKRKIGCIDVAMQIGRKYKLEDDYVLDSTIWQGKFGSVWLCQRKTSLAEFACKLLNKGMETVQREVEIIQHLSGHPVLLLCMRK